MGKPSGVGRSFGGLEGNAATSRWKTGQSKIYIHGLCCNPVHPSLSRVSAKAGKGWVLKWELKRVDWRRGVLLVMWRWHAGVGVKSSVTRNAPEGSMSDLPPK